MQRALDSAPVISDAFALVLRRAAITSRLRRRTAPRPVSRRQCSFASSSFTSPVPQGSHQRPTAAAPLTRGAAVAVPGDCDRVAIEVEPSQLPEVHSLFRRRAATPTQPQRQAEHLIEVAVVNVALPVHTDQAAAHDSLQVVITVRAL